LELELIISVKTLHLKVNKYDCLLVSCSDAASRVGKKTRQKDEEKANEL